MITTINEFKIMLENAHLKKYLGQCDTLRRGQACNEEFWQNMMNNKIEIPFKEFIDGIDASKFLDEDETMSEYIDNSLRIDSDTKTYISKWDDKDVVFLQTAGFEFIFI